MEINDDNPFGDSNLHQTFIWKKKYDKLGYKDIDPAEIERQNKIKLEENKRELEKIKRRRIEREREREDRLRQLEQEQRDKEAKQFSEWAKQEDIFHLKQAKLRSQLRMKDGRAKAIDVLARYIDVFGEKENPKDEKLDDEYLNFDFVEPYLCLNGLRISDLEDLQEDVKVYMKQDSKLNIDYWKDLQIIVNDELNKLRAYQTSQKNVDAREGINSAVNEEVTSIFANKTPQQLESLQISIENKIKSGQEGIDISYWETLLSKLKAIMARARIKERHEKNLKNKLEILKKEQAIKSEPSYSNLPSTSTGYSQDSQDSSDESQADEQEAYDNIKNYIDEYEKGHYSPKLINPNHLEADAIILDPEEDMKRLHFRREQILHGDTGRIPLTAEELEFEREARKGINSFESIFNTEEVIKQDRSIASWSDKYRPRKPRYFNRVHTGFEWNKYNQTHYDVDNPPPKIVQGYKFNIFYPDLIDKNHAPTYTVTTCSDNKDFAIIKFKAGPPYEDIAFKIVNREWNYSYKSGFRSQFHNNILQLWFHFKRYRYRR